MKKYLPVTIKKKISDKIINHVSFLLIHSHFILPRILAGRHFMEVETELIEILCHGHRDGRS